MSATYTFNVRHGGEIISVPLKTSTELPAFAMRHDGQNWFNKLVSPNDPLASKIRLRYSGADWALSLDDDGSETGYDTSAATYGVHKFWLPFTDELTDDIYWNQAETSPNSTSTYYHKWESRGSPTIQNDKLLLDGNSYICTDDVVHLGAQDFTIDLWGQMLPEAGYMAGIFQHGTTNIFIRLHDRRYEAENGDYKYKTVDEIPNKYQYLEVCLVDSNNVFTVFLPSPLTDRFHFAFVYHHPRNESDTGISQFFFNGQLVQTYALTIPRSSGTSSSGYSQIGHNDYFVTPRLPKFSYDGRGWYDPTGGGWAGTIENFRIIDGVALWSEDFTPPSTHAEYVAQMNAIPNSAVVPPARTRPTPEPYLKSWLPFDDNTAATSVILKKNNENKFFTFDKCGNYWNGSYGVSITTTNAVSNYALQLNKAYIRTDDFIEFGGSDFAVELYAIMESTSNSGAVFFSATAQTEHVGSKYGDHDYSYKAQHTIAFGHKKDTTDFYCIVCDGYGNATAEKILPNYLDEFHHYVLDYHHSINRLVVYVDNTEVAVLRVNIPRVKRCLYLGRRSSHGTLEMMKGSIDEFKLYDGKAMFEYEEPPAPVVENPFRYENAGTASTLTISGTTLTNLPESKSRTGSAFYQTARQKCFDLPAASEVWMKFDVYFDGSNRWRAYNGGTNGTTGITAQTTTEASFFSNGTNVRQCATGTVAKNQLQTVLLHMISGNSDGVVEAWVDGTLIYSYSGDVNHGSDFADIYLQSDGAGTFFSNVIISNEPIALSENVTP